MSIKKEYQAAMAKVTPRDDWQQATLQRLAAERKALEASGGKTPKAPVAFIKKPIFYKRILPLAGAAAALLFLAVPALRGAGVYSGGVPEAAAQSSAANEHAPNRVAGDADGGNGMPRAALFSEPDLYEASQDTLPEADMKKDADSAPISPLSLPALLSLPDDFLYRTSNTNQIASANPTYNLPAGQLPTVLPVWQAPNYDDTTLLDGYLERAADALDYGLFIDESLSIDGASPRRTGFLMDRQLWNPDRSVLLQNNAKRWRIEAEGANLYLYPVAAADGAVPQTDLQKLAELDSTALATFGALADFSYPAYQAAAAHMDYSGEVSYPATSHFYYERGSAGDDIALQLEHYCFNRLYSRYNAQGGLVALRFTMPPLGRVQGNYPLRSLGSALKDGVSLLNESFEGSRLLQSEVTKANIVAWQLDYALDEQAGVFYPVYSFTAKLPQPTGKNADGYALYLQYSVPALSEGYLEAAPAQLDGLRSALAALQ